MHLQYCAKAPHLKKNALLYFLEQLSCTLFEDASEFCFERWTCFVCFLSHFQQYKRRKTENLAENQF